MLRKMVVLGERITEEEIEDSGDTDTASIGDIDESSPSILSPDSGILSPDAPDRPPSPTHTHSNGKAKKTKGREPY